MIDRAKLESCVLQFAELIKDNFSLCEFLGKTERDILVAQTIHACRTNLDEYGEAFSYKVPLSNSPHARYASSYQWCLANVLFREEKRNPLIVDLPVGVVRHDDGQVVVIIPTETLFRRLAAHFEVQEAFTEPSHEHKGETQ